MPLSVPLRIRSSSNKMKASQKHSYPALKTAYSSPLAKRDIFQVTSSGTRIYASCCSEYWSKIDTTIELGRNFIVDEFSNLCGNKILFYFTMFVWTHVSHAFSILKHDVPQSDSLRNEPHNNFSVAHGQASSVNIMKHHKIVCRRNAFQCVWGKNDAERIFFWSKRHKTRFLRVETQQNEFFVEKTRFVERFS